MTFESILSQHFPGALPEARFVQDSLEYLKPYGFTRETAIACVGVCRDEISQSFVNLVNESWGVPFIFSALGAMIFVGKTGFKAAEHHAPVVAGREHYVFFGLPHIAIGPEGEIGQCRRPGREEPSNACGALCALQKELSTGQARTWLEPEDPEYSLLKQKLVSSGSLGSTPDLLALTRRAYSVILDDIKHLAAATVDTSHADYAIWTGIQVHGSQGTWVWPGERLVVVRGEPVNAAV
jgi:hypothetical protein